MPGEDVLSSILGWVSIACWIIVFTPQIYENFLLQSGEGLSVLFVAQWLLGDLCNLVGAIWGGLLPTVIILGAYYSSNDLFLMLQIFYYRWKRSRLSNNEHEDQTPLLSDDNRVRVREENPSTRAVLVRYTGALLFVTAVGVAAWWFSKDGDASAPPEEDLRWEIQALGWASALCYLGARVPQIFKNFKSRCEGLSPALFFFAIFGNSTYALSICAKSMDLSYLILNAGWLAGSGLTVFLDGFVLCQIFYYRSLDRVPEQPAGR